MAKNSGYKSLNLAVGITVVVGTYEYDKVAKGSIGNSNLNSHPKF
jgi:hypothetical protein